MATLKKVLKIVAIVVALIIVIPLVAALFVKKDYSVEREITINRPAHEVFDYIKYLRNQDNYSVWATMDPDMKQEFRGTDGTVGFVSVWEGNEDVGKGEQEIVRIVEGERIEYEVRFIEPFEARANSFMAVDSLSENQTSVTWGFESRMRYPMNLMLLFMDIEAAIGNDLASGLVNFKELLENEPGE